jgi:hypothetical protein
MKDPRFLWVQARILPKNAAVRQAWRSLFGNGTD